MEVTRTSWTFRALVDSTQSVERRAFEEHELHGRGPQKKSDVIGAGPGRLARRTGSVFTWETQVLATPVSAGVPRSRRSGAEASR
jgi:hypothetical protein